MPGNRRSIRLRDHDYSQAGAYYVTICAHERQCVFGDVKNGEMVLNETGKIVEFSWLDLPRHNGNIVLDQFIVMPNHIHGIIMIVGAGSKPALKHDEASMSCNEMNPNGKMTIHDRASLEPAPTRHGLSEIVRQFKTFSAKRVNQINKTPGTRLWQRNFYEHIIRDESDLARVREYIITNPTKWADDEYYAM